MASVLRAAVGTTRWWSLAALAALLAFCLLLSLATGGADVVAPHWYYVPIVLAGLRFGPTGAVAVAVLAGVLAGPLTPADVDTGTTQSAAQWVTRAGFFLAIGAAVAFIFERTVDAVEGDIDEHRFERDLIRAIADDELTLEYQPVLAVGGEDGDEPAVVGAEALLRWHHPTEGPVPPSAFVPAAEANGLIVPLGAWVLDQACAQLAAWERDVLDADHPFRLSVNVSGRQLDDGFVDTVQDVLARRGVDPNRLVIEVTERSLLHDHAGTVRRLAALRALGIGVALDDFGTGYSSLAYLGDLPVDIVKIDRAFIAGLDHEREAEDTIVGAVLRLARDLGLTAVAEGVETEHQLEVVQRLGCDLVQGFLFSPSVPADRMAGLLAGPGSLTPRRRIPLAAPSTDEAERWGDWLGRDRPLTAVGSVESSPEAAMLGAMFLSGALITFALSIVAAGRISLATVVLGASAIPLALLLLRSGRRMPRWALHPLLVAGTLIVTMAIALDPVNGTAIATSTFYLWVLVYAGAVFTPRIAALHGGLAGGAFLLVLTSKDIQQADLIWLVVMATGTVAAGLVAWMAEQLRRLAATDPLTGLPNRQAFEAMLDREIIRANREDTPLCLALLDVDGFKHINDTRGHQAGDAVLAELPRRWAEALRESDLMARYGGDEFVVLLPQCTLDHAGDAMRRMSGLTRPTCSAGVAAVGRGETPEALLARVDASLYRAKRTGTVVQVDRSLPPGAELGSPAAEPRSTPPRVSA